MKLKCRSYSTKSSNLALCEKQLDVWYLILGEINIFYKSYTFKYRRKKYLHTEVDGFNEQNTEKSYYNISTQTEIFVVLRGTLSGQQMTYYRVYSITMIYCFLMKD